MFSYLRPHRRTPSNPSSPVPDQTHSWDAPLPHSIEHGHPHAGRAYDRPSPQRSSPATTASPSFLPPIARVASPPLELQEDDGISEELGLRSQRPASDVQSPASQGSRGHQEQGLQAHSQSPSSAGYQSTAQRIGPQTPRAPADQFWEDRPTSGTSPYDSAPGPASTASARIRRPTGTRMPTPPPQPAPNLISTFEPAQHRSGKARLNLLNPMSLLARRRTSQAVAQITPVPVPKNTADSKPQGFFDPRIRGTKVHDFNAPRPKRNALHGGPGYMPADNHGGSAHQRSPITQTGEVASKSTDDKESSPWSGGNHTPVFTEDFEEEQYPAAGVHVRKASDLSDLTAPKPAFAKGASPTTVPSPIPIQNSTTASSSLLKYAPSKPASEDGPPLPPKANVIVVVAPKNSAKKRVSIDTHAAPRTSTSSARLRSRNVSDVSTKDVSMHGLPKHMKSTSSRFSFDMMGAAEQEKILEDRHRQKALEKSSTSPVLEDDRGGGDEEEEFDCDNMDDEGDVWEERIPGVNADADEEELCEGEIVTNGPMPGLGVGAFTFHSLAVSVDNGASSPKSSETVLTPRDANGEVIGFAKGSPGLALQEEIHATELADLSDPRELEIVPEEDTKENGLGLLGVKDAQLGPESSPEARAASTTKVLLPSNADDHDDLYYDDGLIDDIDDMGGGAEFDESVFDNEDTDEYGRPMRPISSLPTLYSPPYVRTDPLPTEQIKSEAASSEQASQAQHFHMTTSPSSTSLPGPHAVAFPNNNDESSLHSQPSVSLTHDTLSAYQNALAAAAHNAAASGRFRPDSDSVVASNDPDKNSPPDRGTDSRDIDPDLPNHSGHDDEVDDFDYDDALDDDAIIAEANAEALANDPDGFYGQEFGFYSAPAADQGFYANGGYFGPRGFDDLVRSKSGRVAGREPNLTPITERSEYSNRNSMMSLLQLGGPAYAPSASGSSVNNPGLAQLAGMLSEHDDDSMSLTALMKLRRGAWGGSQVGSIGNDSPMSATGDEVTPASSQSLLSSSSAFGGHMRRHSAFSVGLGSEGSSAAGSPTLPVETMAKSPEGAMGPPPLPPAPPAALLQSLHQRPLSPPVKNGVVVGMVDAAEAADTAFARQGRSHRHTGSADSISYMKEEDPLIGERWVLERRRTGESGEVEILGREIVLGGRI
ncbi:MAG: hypothetical protein M1818_007057 [Claussenomyces sp. TS43310]|nr:MAG: hypothetical protein M1818_007057 [Claussenomyces sp. TS43310]